MIRSYCPSPDAYYLFTYDRGADGVLRARYLIPDALNISDAGRVICLSGDSTFGSAMSASLGLTGVTIAP